jgi:two-component system cell cycle response regulator
MIMRFCAGSTIALVQEGASMTQSYLDPAAIASTYPKMSFSLVRSRKVSDTVPPDHEGPRTVLIVDEDDERRSTMAELLRGDGFMVVEGSGVRRVFSEIVAFPPDLVVLGAELGGISWADACRELRLLDPSKMMPIVLSGGGGDEAAMVAGIEAGADDYVADTTRVGELKARIHAQLRHRRDREVLMWAREQRSSFRAQALTDPLTRVGNRRHGMSVLEDALSRGEPVGVLMVDLDHFKRVNDAYGHRAGDVVLKRVAQALEQNVPSGSVVSRWGGEEFTIIVRGDEAVFAVEVAERCREAIAQLHSFGPAGPSHVTASIGVVPWSAPEGASSGADLLAQADEALHAAKHNGRDQVSVASAPELRRAGERA